MSSVRKILLSNCNIKEIQQQPFADLNELEELYLDQNKLDDNSLNFLGTLERLHTLDISQNNFHTLPNLTGLTSLYDLYASYNEFDIVKSGTFNNTDIHNLHMSGNYFLHEIADDAFLPLTGLEVLDVSWSALKKLPRISHMSNLADLNIVHSEFEELPADLCEHSPKLIQLTAENNQLKGIPDLQNCSSLSIAFFDFNKIKKIGKNTFSGLKNLLSVFVHHNEIEEVHPDAFQGLTRMSHLHLAYNQITTIHSRLLDGLTNLDYLELQYNNISSLPNGVFKDLVHLQILYINDNRISSVAEKIFPSNMTWLQKLNISNNPQMSRFPLPTSGLPFLHTFAMKNLPRMLSVPSISEIPRIQFVYMTYAYHCCIYRDHLPDELLITPKKVKKTEDPRSESVPTDSSAVGNGTHVSLTEEHESDETILIITRPSSEPLTLPPHVIESHLFPASQDPYNPKDHDITQQEIDDILKEFAAENNFSIRVRPNNQLDIVGFDGEDVKVFGGIKEDSVKRLFSRWLVYNNNSQVYCDPAPNAFMPCESLLDPDPVRVLVWIVWFPAILGNIAVIFVTLASTEKVDVPSFILCNLALADFMLGVFLSFLGVVDVRTFGDGSFYKSALHWQKGPGCQTAGFIGVFSNELSVYLMVILTLERLHTIVYSFNQQGSRMKMRHAVVLVGIGWIFAAIAAALPLFNINSYQEVAICLPFRTEYLSDKIYIGVLLSLSVAAFSIVLFSYVHILVVYCKSPACEKRFQERVMTSVKMGVLVVTNSISWLPLAVLGLAALADVYLINLTVAKYFIVLIFPLNACLNPFLYTISKKTFWERCQSICRKSDQRFQDVTSSRRRNSLASASSISGNDIDFELLQKRQSRRSFSLQMETSSIAATSSSQSTSPLPRMGRRNSSPAIFGIENGVTPRRGGTRNPSEPTLMEPEIRFPRPPNEFGRTASNCLSIVQEETSVCGSDNEEDYCKSNPISPLRFSAEYRALQKTNSGMNAVSVERHDVSEYVRRRIHRPLHDASTEEDRMSDASSCSEYDDARSSPLPPCILHSLQQYHNTLDCGESSSDDMNRYSSSTTGSYSVVSKSTHQNMITRIINPHTKNPVKGVVESTC